MIGMVSSLYVNSVVGLVSILLVFLVSSLVVGLVNCLDDDLVNIFFVRIAQSFRSVIWLLVLLTVWSPVILQFC